MALAYRRRRVSASVLLAALVTGAASVTTAQAATLPLVSVLTGQCMAVNAASLSRDAPIVQRTCAVDASQQWTFRPDDTGFRLVAQHSGKCLAMSSGWSFDGIPAVQDDCKSYGSDGVFDFRPLGRGYEMVVRETGKCLALENGSSQSGTRIVQQTCNASPSQTWATDRDQDATSAWTPPRRLSLVPVSAAHLPNGKLLLWSARDRFAFGGDGGRTYTTLFDPETSSATETLITNTGHDMFCPGIANLPDGRLHVAGGSSSEKTSLYDARSDAWTAGEPMTIGRGYQGSVLLANGSVLTYGGSYSGGQGSKTGEVWTEGGGWRKVPNLSEIHILTGDSGGAFRSDNHGWFFAVGGGPSTPARAARCTGSTPPGPARSRRPVHAVRRTR